MPRSGEQAWCRGPREASSEAEAHARGEYPRARWELARGGATPSSDMGVSQCGVCPLSETEVPRGVSGLAVLWAAEVFWAMGLSLPWAAAMRGVICSRGFDRLFFRKGWFPLLLGDSYDCPQQYLPQNKLLCII
jgi:hypothetical protein